MRKTITMGALALGGMLLAGAPAQATPTLFYNVGSDTFDFGTLADTANAAKTDITFATSANTLGSNKEQRAAEIAFKGLTMWLVVSAGAPSPTVGPDAYMDSATYSPPRPAGLGVCSEKSGDCGSGDNTSAASGGERLIFKAYAVDDTDFSNELKFSLTGLQFRDADHNVLTADDKVVEITDGGDGPGTDISFLLATLNKTFFSDAATDALGFRYDNQQFYIETATAAIVPVPAALPIIAAALAGFGFTGYRSRRPNA